MFHGEKGEDVGEGGGVSLSEIRMIRVQWSGIKI